MNIKYHVCLLTVFYLCIDDKTSNKMSEKQEGDGEAGPSNVKPQLNSASNVSIRGQRSSISSIFSWLDDRDFSPPKDSQWLLRRHDTIFDYEYKYRTGMVNI